MYLKTLFFKLIFVTIFISLAWSCGNNQRQDVANQTDSALVDSSSGLDNRVSSITQQIVNNPNNAELYYDRSVIYFEDKYLDLALSDIEHAIQIDSLNPLFHFYKGRICYAMNKTIMSSQAYEQAITLKPSYVEARLKLGELYYIVKEHQKSLAQLNAISSYEKGNATSYYFKGMNYKEMMDTNRAINAFQTAFEYDPNFYDASLQLGILYTYRGSKLALEYLNSCLRLNPKSDEAYFARAFYYHKNFMYKESISDYRKVIAINPSSTFAYYNVGYINFELNHFDEAIRNWNICIQMDNQYINAYYMRGLVNEMSGKKEDARLNYKYVLEIDPKNAMAQLGLKRLEKK
jgi:tetratricopeptide (TPR) repeat protein